MSNWARAIPHLLTGTRLVLFAVIAFLVFQSWHIAAGMLFFLGAVTDFFDGRLARRFNVGSSHGDLFDRVVDAVFWGGTLAVLLFADRVRWWHVAALTPYLYRVVVWSIVTYRQGSGAYTDYKAAGSHPWLMVQGLVIYLYITGLLLGLTQVWIAVLVFAGLLTHAAVTMYRDYTRLA